MRPSASRDAPARGQASNPRTRCREWMASGELVAQKYRLQHRLGQGAMGSVWAATHLALETPVAIKFLTWDATSDADSEQTGEESSASSHRRAIQEREDARARFEREAKAAAQIRSANVVQVFDYGVDRGVPFIVMELLEGEDLNQRLRREGKLTPAAAARLVQAISRALQRAHCVGLVHRDLKPGNIFLAREGDREVPKVVDFGVAKALGGEQKRETDSSENTMEGTLIGTPSYMSPEQATGRIDIDHRSDLWSVGVILFQVLTGMKPFPGGNLFESLVRICSDPIPRASSIAPDLPQGTDAFFERALERDVGKRFQSARELERAFYALVARPTGSLPPDAATEPHDAGNRMHVGLQSTFEVGGVQARSRRTLALVAVAAAGLVVGGGALAWRSRGTAVATAPASAAPGATALTQKAASASVPSEVPAPATTPASASASSPSPSAPEAATASAAPVPRASAARAPTRPAAEPVEIRRKPKRDLGY